MKFMAITVLLLVATRALTSVAGPEAFSTGPVIEGFGPVASVPGASAIPDGTVLKVAFDLKDAAGEGEINRGLATAARFLNMHGAAGMTDEQLKVALVIHGAAHRDFLTEKTKGSANPNAKLVAMLVEHGVKIQLCGQTAAYYGIDGANLLPGVEMSLSAMTAHALLQQQGYTLNPF